jgi:outer membrane protease
MKTLKNMKKTLLALVVLLTTAKGFSFTIEPPHVTVSYFGSVMLGQAKEYVYVTNQYADNQSLSELDWDILPIVSPGLGANIGWDGGLQLSGDISAGLAGLTTGSMEDSDWLNLETNGDTTKTTFSKHTAKLDFAYAVNARVGWECINPDATKKRDELISITPFIGFKYITMKWDASDGYMQHTTKTGGVYAAWSADQEKVPCYGTVISYQQEYWMPEMGFAISVPLGSRFSITATFAGSVWVFCYGIDNHYVGTSYGTYADFTNATRSNNYYDILSDGYMLEPEISFRWIAMPKLSVFLEGKWTTIGSLRGNTAARSSLGGVVYWSYESAGNGGGAALNAATIRLGVDFTLL